MIDRAPGDADLHALVEDFFRTSFSTDNPLITEAVRRMLKAGGKRLRPRLTLLAAEAVGGNARDHLPLAAYMELIHVATLIHDDVVDQAETRRGVNSTAVDFGNRVSVLAGDYLFAWIFKNVTATYDRPIPHILSATLAAICDGEVLQLRALGNLALSVDQYTEIVQKKTATLFAASAECGAHVNAAGEAKVQALHDFGDLFGIAFQMRDDVLDMTALASDLGKPVGNDLRERKVTLPLILALERATPDFRADVERFYEGDDSSSEAIAAIVAGITKAGGLERAHEYIAAYARRATAALAPLGAVPARAGFLALAESLTTG